MAKPAMHKPAMPKGCSAFDSKLITEVRNGDEIKIFSESYTDSSSATTTRERDEAKRVGARWSAFSPVIAGGCAY